MKISIRQGTNVTRKKNYRTNYVYKFGRGRNEHKLLLEKKKGMEKVVWCDVTLILKRILVKQDTALWHGLIWLRIRNNGELL